MKRLTGSTTDPWPERPICARCGRVLLAGEMTVLVARGATAGTRHARCLCPTCGKDTSGSEEWSTAQCDDCFLATPDHAHGVATDRQFPPSPPPA